MRQASCPHGSTFAHSKLLPDGNYLMCPGPLDIKVEPTTTKEGDIDKIQRDMDTK